MIKELDRINELARIQRDGGLTDAEKVEQQVLREDYLTSNSWASARYFFSIDRTRSNW